MIPLTDNPLERLDDDAFGFAPHVEELHRAVLAAEPLPLTVGVFGGWGTGKSSFLGMWRDLLKQESPETHTVWFNPWKYDRKVEVWQALLHTVLTAIEEAGGRRKQVRELARAAAWLSLRAGLGQAASLATAGVVGSAEVNRLFDTLTEDDAKQYSAVNEFETKFDGAVEDIVGPDGRLVVFIDDLDRCTPDSAITVLESLKLFMGHARCVFVLALDVDVLTAVSTHKFAGALKGAPEESVSGTRYLEKIVQLPFFLPEVPLAAIRSTLRPHVAGLADDDAFWELIERGLGTNPRRVKRFVNVLELATTVDKDWYGDRRRRLQLAKLLLFRSEHRSFFHLLTREPGAWQEVEADPLAMQEDDALRRLIDLSSARGTYHNHPPAPNSDEVSRMLSTLAPVDRKVHQRTESSS